MIQELVKVQAGSYYYTSWGYDQTNIDYLVVVKVSSSGKTARCRMVSPISLGIQGVEEMLTPGTPYGELFNMQVRPNGNLRGSYPYCQGLPDKRLGTFLPTKLGEVRGQTLPQFGH